LDALNFVVVHHCGDSGENFVGEAGVVDCARDDEGSDEAGIGGERFLAAKIIGVALNVAGEIVEEGAKFVGEGAANRGALACDFRSECGHGAAAAGAVAMLWREIGGGEGFEGIAGGLVDDVGPVLPHPRDSACTGLGDEVFFGFEVAVEAAVGEAGCLHEVGYADAVDATLAKEPGGYVEDSLVVFGFLDTAYFHKFPFKKRTSCVQLYYMTAIMIGAVSLCSSH
jgi:hypothetical protein